ncbi:MAG TPA: C40 family peptidase [Gemmatimonadaceae bacterium]|nr:C40 family peptidase [Gemmatimonadaceae bacterium]
MLFRTATAIALAIWLVRPVSAGAQLRLSDIRMRDVATVVNVAIGIHERSERNRRTTSRPRAETPRRTGGSASAGTRGTTVSRGGSSRAGAMVVARGEDYLGVPYKWGGSTPSGFDCSGFVQYIYRDQGVSLPRTSRQMAHAGVEVPADVSRLREGDLMLFASDGWRIDHVGIYAGNNQIIHSSSSGKGVRYDDLGSSRGRWYVNHMVAARRVTDNGRSLVNALVTGMIPFDFFDPPDKAPGSR